MTTSVPQQTEERRVPAAEVARDETALRRMVDDRFAFNSSKGTIADKEDFIKSVLKLTMVGQTVRERTVLIEDVFAGFTNNALSNALEGTEVLFSLGADSRDQDDDLARRARPAGGTVFGEPGGANDFLYGCGFCDSDEHRWNVLFVDARRMPRRTAPDALA